MGHIGILLVSGRSAISAEVRLQLPGGSLPRCNISGDEDSRRRPQRPAEVPVEMGLVVEA